MLEIKNLTREFPGVKALDNVSAQFELGEIHALMGENGAGKSTLMKIITGIYRADFGEIYVDGKKAVMKCYKDSTNYNISMVHQEISVIPASTVAENIVLDKLDKFTNALGIVNWKKINEIAKQYLEIVDLHVRPTDIIGGMTAAQKQLIQIAKALSADAKYILLDEPTSSLTTHEVDNLFRIVRKLRDQNRCIIFVSHKIEEVLSLCDRVTVLRDGKNIGTREVKDISRNDLVRMMIGREESIEYFGKLDVSDQIALEARHIRQEGMFRDVSLKLYKGEILGFYGLVGSGRTELVRLLVGAEHLDSGEVFINGKKTQISSIKDALKKYKLCYITENRKEEGLILPFSVNANMTVTALDRARSVTGSISSRKCAEMTSRMIRELSIKTPSQQTKIENLSGGNQQKVSIGKWLLAGTDILIIDEPTVGVDVGAKRQIHEIIWNLAKNEGKSIILISSDMSEMLTLARRILVFRDFEIAAEIGDLNRETEPDYNDLRERIGSAMA